MEDLLHRVCLSLSPTLVVISQRLADSSVEQAWVRFRSLPQSAPTVHQSIYCPVIVPMDCLVTLPIECLTHAC
mgnify:FL=1|jgi:hypothetical protein